MLNVIVAGIALVLVSVTANAEVYVWRDAQGILNYSDRPPREGARELRTRSRQPGIGGNTNSTVTRQRTPASTSGSIDYRSGRSTSSATATGTAGSTQTGATGGSTSGAEWTSGENTTTTTPSGAESSSGGTTTSDSGTTTSAESATPPAADGGTTTSDSTTSAQSAAPPAAGETTTTSDSAAGSDTASAPTASANLLFRSGFEGLTALNPPTAGWQDIVGLDGTTGFTWPGSVWGGSMKFQTITGLPINDATTENYMVNRIETVTGHDGNPTRALYMEIKRKGGTYIQDAFLLLPASEQGDMYISFWVKFQPDLLQKMTPQNWRALFEWKTAGDYRMTTYVASWEDGCGGVKPNGALFWRVRGDNEANGGLPYQEFWRVDDCSKVVPVGEWFKIEGFWHRSSGADGRIWIAVNGQVIADRYGPNKGVRNAPINRIFLPVLYSETPYPIYQWVDNLQIWDGFPADAAPH
jgi:hypothetical protein